MTLHPRIAVVPVFAATRALSACGGSTTGSSGGAGMSSGSTAGTVAKSASTAGACPTSNTKAFAKTRFVADVGLAAGTFHHWIYTPFKAGAFAKGAKGRVTALIKAGAVAIVDAKLAEHAYQDVEASPALCKVLIAPLGALKTELTSLKGKMVTGDTSSLAGVDGLVQQIESTASSNGAAITENADLNSAQAASNS